MEIYHVCFLIFQFPHLTSLVLLNASDLQGHKAKDFTYILLYLGSTFRIIHFYFQTEYCLIVCVCFKEKIEENPQAAIFLSYSASQRCAEVNRTLPKRNMAFQQQTEFHSTRYYFL